MAETLNLYKPFMQSLLNKEVDMDSDDIRVMLVGSSYTPDSTAHAYKSDITAEISGTNYTAGGLALENKEFSIADGVCIFKADNAMWPELTTESDIRYGVIYDNSPEADEAKPLIAYIDFEEAFAVLHADFEIVWSAAGILRIKAV